MSSIPADAYLLIIGAMKSGTTSLYEYIVQHPEICGCRVKEPEFFSRKQAHRTIVEEYEDLWQFDSERHRYAMEASTGYTKYPMEGGVPERIRKKGLDPLFIYVMRDPFDRIESHFNAARTNSSWSYGITDEHLISISNYYLQLSRYREIFPAGKILLLDFDELIRDPRSVLEKVYDFADLSHDHYPENFQRLNATPSLSRLQLIHRRSSLLNWIGRMLPGRMRRAVKKSISKSKAVPRIRLTETQRDSVRDSLADDMRKLKEEYGFDVVKWGF